jgi:putative spermidine/putrescine transport system ATP-binding protein
MYKGRMEQVGAPFEIYNFPQTEFVAQFVGTLNANEGEVVDPVNQLLSINGQNLQTSEDLTGMQRGQKVMLAIRPERLSFSSEGKKANLLNCQVDNITFLGSIVRITVNIGGHLLFMDTFNNPFLALPNIGDQAEITCSKEAVLILSKPKAEAVSIKQ